MHDCLQIAVHVVSECMENEHMVHEMYVTVSTYLANLLCAMANSGRLPMTYPLF